MKLTAKYYSLFTVVIFISSFCIAQNDIEGYIYDDITKKPLPYAAIVLGNTGIYTTSNEDGKFLLNPKKNMDSLLIRYLGYEIKKVSKDYFLSKKILYLKPFSTLLNVAFVNTSKEDLYKLLFKLIKKYRNNREISKNKVYYTLNSKSHFPSNPEIDTIPLEQIEGLYSGKQQLSKGILNLNLKTGRFGQNQKFPFYSLNHILLLSNFNLFKKNTQFLPQYPGNLSLSKIKKKYNLELDQTSNYNGTIISFSPKKEKGIFFSGKVFFQKNGLIIEKIELFIKKPKKFKLHPLVENDSLSIKNLTLTIFFNPIDLNKIQYYDFGLDIVYYSHNVKRNIMSKALLYLYDYNTSFTKPYFTNTIYFENDYDKILALPVSDNVWKQNYPYPRSKKSTEISDFFKEKNQFFNYYKNELPLNALAYIKTSSIIWNKKRKLLSEDIKDGPGINLNFSYTLNSYKNEGGSYDFITKTLFDLTFMN